jgi:hypothetical protein
MNKHTPGPWKAFLRDGHWRFIGGKHELCVVARNSTDEDRANVRLIAAAPKLLQELGNMVICWERFEDTHTHLVMEAARAAIVEATGRQV